MTNIENNNKRLMREGQKLFVHELEGQLQRLSLLSETLRTEAEPSPDSALQLYRIVHTVKGSAGIFGFSRIGRLAERLVHLWEWTQELPDGAELRNRPWSQSLQEAVAGTPDILHEFGMEYDVSRVEYDKNEQKEQAKQLLTVTAKSRLLVIDDDDVQRSYLVRRLLLEGYEVSEAADVDSAKRLLRERTFDLIMLDMIIYPNSGFELFEFLKEDPTLQWIPTIVISESEDVADKVRCFYLGADDYVTKPFQYAELAARIYRLLKRTKSFEQLAFRDPLTGVYNRHYFDNQIKIELQRVERYPAPLSIVFLDIDRFKAVNDTYGHHIGDLVLQGLSHAVRQRLRATDMLARFGGEEFVIVMPNTSAQQGLQVVEDILEAVRSNPTAQHEGQEYRITFSAGVAEWIVGQSVKDWLQTADFAMYQAKQQGRNRVLIAASEIQAKAQALNILQTPVERRSILVADGDRILRSIVVGRLQELPVDIVEAENGEEAYRLLTSKPFDLCILDGMMPGLDGFSILERLHTEQTPYDTKRTKVLMLSGRKKEDDIARGYRQGTHDYMPKPFSLVELDLRVRRLLEL